MTIDIREVFNTQWHYIQDVVLSEAKRQLDIYGKVNIMTLSDRLEQETSKWKKGVLVRGLLYSEIARKDPSKALHFAETAEGLQFTEPKFRKTHSTWWMNVVCFLLAAIIAFLLYKYTGISCIEQMFYTIFSYVIFNAFCVPIKKKVKRENINRILADIEGQMQDMRSILEQYI